MRILIVEEALQSGIGHWPAYIGDIASGLRDLGCDVDVAVHQNASLGVIDKTRGTPWFSRNCWNDVKSRGAVGGIIHNFFFGRELARWLRTREPYDWVCALTMRLQHLLAIALLFFFLYRALHDTEGTENQHTFLAMYPQNLPDFVSF